ncbi:uncharacterized protein PAC_15844 [Phialocephala subalpina]|uniref:Zn(2)-C6 fungal-type domain-containing protein n=1 Tax=Phialocephala subalpina TaxID=576137 RepID=A0A1L7XLR1_9HELO|nr:uncharacterized protein PAC_15844 [Phialocephala subalpina]
MLQTSPSLIDRRAGTVSKRRNGLNPACESCRKAKVRCDITPSETVCARCKKRKNPSSCVFLEAPMTKERRESPVQKTESSPQSVSPAFANCSPTPTPSTNSPRTTEKPGYLGLTSYSATLHHAGLHSPDETMEECAPTLECDKVASGVLILRQLPDEKTCHILLDNFIANSVSLLNLPRSAVKHIMASIFTTFGPSLKKPYLDSELEKVSRHILSATQTPVEEPDDPAEWLESMSGKNIRWDFVGLLFIMFACGMLGLPDSEYAQMIDKNTSTNDRKNYMKGMRTAVERCSELARDSMSPMFCNLLYKNLLFETVLQGDSSLAVWRLHHDLVAVASAIGLHCYQGTPTVTVRSEMTKRMSACVFRNDKEIAMFIGRPPALSHRYYTCPLPLDLHDDVLMEGGEALQREIDALDENGWNTKGKVYDATICRMVVLSAMIQDEVMELFLGAPSQFSMERVNSLKSRTIETFQAIPYLISATKERLLASESNFLLWRLLFGRMDYLRIHFLLERLSVERGHESKQKLIDVSREMVDLTVFLWLQRDRSFTKYYDFDYTIMCFGMPSTGILCAELLKQIRHPKTASDLNFPSAEVVQNLSYMIGFLEWIKPEAGNYKLCRHMAQVIKRVLEQAFEPPPVEEVPAVDRVAELDPSMWDGMGIDDFEWLNNVDWGRGAFPFG